MIILQCPPAKLTCSNHHEVTILLMNNSHSNLAEYLTTLIFESRRYAIMGVLQLVKSALASTESNPSRFWENPRGKLAWLIS